MTHCMGCGAALVPRDLGSRAACCGVGYWSKLSPTPRDTWARGGLVRFGAWFGYANFPEARDRGVRRFVPPSAS